MATSRQFTLWCKNKGTPDTEAWPEQYHEITDDPRAWAKATVADFNRTLKRGEAERVLVRVVEQANSTAIKLAHDWQKVSLVTEAGGYDNYRCAHCGVKGRRYGVNAVAADRGRTECRPRMAAVQPAALPGRVLQLQGPGIAVRLVRGEPVPKLTRHARVLVTGDRNWDDRDAVRRAFRWGRLRRPMTLIDGMARGADTQCYQCGLSAGLHGTRVAAEWEKYGNGAGPRRNLKMLDLRPHLVLAFHNDLEHSKGTGHCVAQALLRSLPVFLIRRRHEHFQVGRLYLVEA